MLHLGQLYPFIKHSVCYCVCVCARACARVCALALKFVCGYTYLSVVHFFKWSLCFDTMHHRKCTTQLSSNCEIYVSVKTQDKSIKQYWNISTFHQCRQEAQSNCLAATKSSVFWVFLMSEKITLMESLTWTWGLKNSTEYLGYKLHTCIRKEGDIFRLWEATAYGLQCPFQPVSHDIPNLIWSRIQRSNSQEILLLFHIFIQILYLFSHKIIKSAWQFEEKVESLKTAHDFQNIWCVPLSL